MTCDFYVLIAAAEVVSSSVNSVEGVVNLLSQPVSLQVRNLLCITCFRQKKLLTIVTNLISLLDWIR